MADRGVNSVVLLGRLAIDPERKVTKNDIPYAWLKIAVNTEQPKGAPSKVDYIRAVLYNCDGVLPYLTKGRQIHVQGRLESYAKEGEQLQMNVNVDRLILTGDRPSNNGGGGPIGDEEREKIEAYVTQLQERNAELLKKNDELTSEQLKSVTPADAPKKGKKRAAAAPAKKTGTRAR